MRDHSLLFSFIHSLKELCYVCKKKKIDKKNEQTKHETNLLHSKTPIQSVTY